MKYLKAIAAMAENRVIGRGGSIPWHLPDDFRWFKQTTMGHALLMGRRTFESIGRPLPGRTTLVLSRSGFSHPGVRTLHDLGELDLGAERGEVFVCGGAEIYRLALPYCSDLYLTHVKQVADGDVLFPPFEQQFHFLEEVLDHPSFRIVHYRNPSPMELPHADRKPATD